MVEELETNKRLNTIVFLLTLYSKITSGVYQNLLHPVIFVATVRI